MKRIKYVFISYCHKDNDVAEDIASFLEKNMFDYFKDNKNIELNEEIPDKIQKEIENTTHFITIISSDSMGPESEWTKIEYAKAEKKSETNAQAQAKAKNLDLAQDREKIIEIPIIIPIVLEPEKASKKEIVPKKLQNSKHINIKNRQLSQSNKNDLIELLINDGIVPSQMLERKKRLLGEVFAAELLNNNIDIKKEKEQFFVQVNRNNVNYCVITTTGKAKLAELFVTPNTIDLKDEDIKIHDVFTRKNELNNYTIRCGAQDLPLRWASGGVLSIVKFKGKNWIPLFFRDIKPDGWNIALGSSERYFDDKWNVINYLNEELNNPDRFLIREFLEEVLVVKGQPNRQAYLEHKRFDLDQEIRKARIQATNFAEEHIKLRQNFDDFTIITNNNPMLQIPCDIIHTNTNLRIIHGKENLSKRNVLIAINLLELGIEVVRVYRYKLDENDYLLDGEVLVNKYGDKELVRMPFALIDFNYLRNKIHSENFSPKYTEGELPSIEIDEVIPPDKIHLFKWDIQRRLEILKYENEAKGDELKRYKPWKKNYANKYFLDDDENIVDTKLPGRFTPATIKILSSLFANFRDPLGGCFPK